MFLAHDKVIVIITNEDDRTVSTRKVSSAPEHRIYQIQLYNTVFMTLDNFR